MPGGNEKAGEQGFYAVPEVEKLAGKSGTCARGRGQTLTTAAKVPSGARKIKASWQLLNRPHAAPRATPLWNAINGEVYAQISAKVRATASFDRLAAISSRAALHPRTRLQDAVLGKPTHVTLQPAKESVSSLIIEKCRTRASKHLHSRSLISDGRPSASYPFRLKKTKRIRCFLFSNSFVIYNVP